MGPTGWALRVETLSSSEEQSSRPAGTTAMTNENKPIRSPTREGDESPRPIYVVWEVTLSCNLKCIHCGSRAGAPRRQELTTDECISVIRQLADLGTREITLIGGEAYLRRDWLVLIGEISSQGILCGLQTGARALTKDKIQKAAQAGLHSAGVSIDGLRATHDRLRGVSGSFDMALDALRNFRRYGLTGTVNTQINSLNCSELRELMRLIIAEGAKGWQVTLTVPMGAAADRPELILQPFHLLELMPLLADLFVEAQAYGLRLFPGNTIGYFGPYESFWRSITGELEHYNGCNAGQTALGIEADGSIKGCPSLPSKDFVGGNVRDASLREIWECSSKIAFMRDTKNIFSQLWGYCRVCYYASVCQGGCAWTAHVISGRHGNNPFCHYRTLELQKRGWKERLEWRAKPKGEPFDFATLEILIEEGSGLTFSQDIFNREAPEGPPEARALITCTFCSQFIYAGSTRCRHCGADLSTRYAPPGVAEVVYSETMVALNSVRQQLIEFEESLSMLVGK
jgi:radical SAM protein with 4Fe4S-binding SPASM domain